MKKRLKRGNLLFRTKHYIRSYILCFSWWMRSPRSLTDTETFSPPLDYAHVRFCHFEFCIRILFVYVLVWRTPKLLNMALKFIWIRVVSRL
jgi:hypothetical protein